MGTVNRQYSVCFETVLSVAGDTSTFVPIVYVPRDNSPQSCFLFGEQRVDPGPASEAQN